VAVSFVANALGGTATTTSFSISLPTTQAGDILILEYTHRGGGAATIGGTSGLTWTQKHSQLYASNTFSGRTLWARATGDHAGTSVSGSGLTNSSAAIVTVYRGALASGDPLADATIVGEQNASGDETQAEITTATDGAWVVLVVVNSPDVAVTSQTCTSPGSLTARAERLSTGGTDTSIAHASAEKATAGATGAFTWAQTNGISGSWAYAIEPEPETPTDFGHATGVAVTTIEAVPPGLIEVGDPVLAHVVHTSASATVTPPTGWTLLGETNPADFTSYLYELDAPWTGSEDLTFGFSVAVNVAVDLYRIPGYEIDAVGTPTQIAAANDITLKVTPTVADTDVLTFASCDATGGARTWTSDVGTEILDRSDNDLHRQFTRRTLVGGSGVLQDTTATISGTIQDLAGIAISLTVAGGGPNEGSASGSIAWVGSATGVRTPKGATSGAVAWVGSATGVRTPKGSASGAVAWVGSATGQQPAPPPNEGSASGAVAWVGSATGARTSSGAATGSIAWVGAATGARTSSGAATGAVAWSGTATGARTPKGSTAGSVTWVGTATGARPSAGSATGSVAWAGSATGEAPGVGAQEGSAEGTIAWAGTATGASTPKGSASGSIAWVGTAAGSTPRAGAASGAVEWSGSATGARQPQGVAAGTVEWVGEATGTNVSSFPGQVVTTVAAPSATTTLAAPAATTTVAAAEATSTYTGAAAVTVVALNVTVDTVEA
jgi:hypothetical protein